MRFAGFLWFCKGDGDGVGEGRLGPQHQHAGARGGDEAVAPRAHDGDPVAALHRRGEVAHHVLAAKAHPRRQERLPVELPPVRGVRGGK